MLVWSFINSNTTLVKVKSRPFFAIKQQHDYSNTTLVKVKSPAAAVIPAVALHSNTTLVKVKFQGGI